jgi:signal transduction histidine kinase
MRPPSSSQRIQTLQDIADDLMQRMHKLAWELRPAALDSFGLEPVLQKYVQDWSMQSGIKAEFVSRGLSAKVHLSPESEGALYRVVQEALTNVQRHADAQNVSVLLEPQGSYIAAIVEDDGSGFEIEQSDPTLPHPMARRLGVLGMQERLELVNGTLTVESAPGVGTTVYARVPFERRHAANSENDSEDDSKNTVSE